jgi:hypothetical protein
MSLITVTAVGFLVVAYLLSDIARAIHGFTGDFEKLLNKRDFAPSLKGIEESMRGIEDLLHNEFSMKKGDGGKPRF